VTIRVRVTPGERERLRETAYYANTSLSEIARSLLLDYADSAERQRPPSASLAIVPARADQQAAQPAGDPPPGWNDGLPFD
jgi:hypothetical protein